MGAVQQLVPNRRIVVGDGHQRPVREQADHVNGSLPRYSEGFEDDSEEGGSTTYFSVKLFGNDPESLTRWGETVAQKLEEAS